MSNTRTASLLSPPSAYGLGQNARLQLPDGECFNVCSHLAGIVLNSCGTLALITQAARQAGPAHVLGLIVFGLTMTMAYVASTSYHATAGHRRQWLRRVDRAAIFLAVAGYHTANLVISTPPRAWAPIMVAIWVLATIAAGHELWVVHGTRARSVLPYLLLGWGPLAAAGQMGMSPSPGGMVWTVSAWLAITLGAAVIRCAPIARKHQIWHVLVLVANSCALAGWHAGLA